MQIFPVFSEIEIQLPPASQGFVSGSAISVATEVQSAIFGVFRGGPAVNPYQSFLAQKGINDPGRIQGSRVGSLLGA